MFLCRVLFTWVLRTSDTIIFPGKRRNPLAASVPTPFPPLSILPSRALRVRSTISVECVFYYDRQSTFARATIVSVRTAIRASRRSTNSWKRCITLVCEQTTTQGFSWKHVLREFVENKRAKRWGIERGSELLPDVSWNSCEYRISSSLHALTQCWSSLVFNVSCPRYSSTACDGHSYHHTFLPVSLSLSPPPPPSLSAFLMRQYISPE